MKVIVDDSFGNRSTFESFSVSPVTFKRYKRPLKDVSTDSLLSLHQHFINDPSLHDEVEITASTLLGQPPDADFLQHYLPNQKIVLDEMKRRNLLLEGKIKSVRPTRKFLAWLHF